MSLDTRLRKLENEQCGRPCIMCGFPSQVQQPIVKYYDEADNPPPQPADEGSKPCLLCGRKPLLIQVVYVQDWQTNTDDTVDKAG